MKILLKLKDEYLQKIDGVQSFTIDEHNNLHLHYLYSDVGSIYHKDKWLWVKEEEGTNDDDDDLQ